MDEQFDLYETYGTLIIAQKQKFICGIDRFTLEEVLTQEIPSDDSKIPFLFVLGIYRYENRYNESIYFLVLVTEVEKFDFFNVGQIKSFKIIPLKYNTERLQDSGEFQELLELGLKHCSMYYSQDYNLSLTLQQQFENRPSREYFVWNYTAIDRLKSIWPTALCFREVIAGYFTQKDPFVLISRKSNRNGGCHTWNRGADANGMCANYIENEEIIILGQSEQGINAISHIEIGASCPFLWSQFPTMHLHCPIHIGPQEENERRFNLHFDHLYETYFDNDKENNSIIAISLLGSKGKEVKLNTIYEELANKRGIDFIHINFNNVMKEQGGLSNEIDKYKDEFDACVIQDGKVVVKQTTIPRINCASCLDRTSVFMENMFRSIFTKYEPTIMCDNVETHKKMWLERADIISRQYAITEGEKTYMIQTSKKTLTGRYHDYSISWQRFFYSIFCEGKYCDAINAVLQEKPFTSFESEKQFFIKFFLFIKLIFVFIFLYIFKGRKVASQTWSERIKPIINHPHIADLHDAEEFYNNNDPIEENEIPKA